MTKTSHRDKPFKVLHRYVEMLDIADSFLVNAYHRDWQKWKRYVSKPAAENAVRQLNKSWAGFLEFKLEVLEDEIQTTDKVEGENF